MQKSMFDRPAAGLAHCSDKFFPLAHTITGQSRRGVASTALLY